MRWLAVDPGATVGWAIGWRKDGAPHVEAFGQLTSADYKALAVQIAIYSVDAVAIERFVPLQSNLAGGSTIATTMGTKIEEMAETFELRIVWQGASQAKGVITDTRLKAMGFWMPGQPHARDAIRHLIIALRREQAGMVQ